MKWCLDLGSPPMMVLMREAWPGQSTRVNWRLSYCCPPPSCRGSGKSTVKEEKPRSSVMPRSRDCGFLSNAAVEAVLLSALASDVFPLSTCPSTPTLKFSVLVRLWSDSDIFLIWSWKCYPKHTCFPELCAGPSFSTSPSLDIVIKIVYSNSKLFDYKYETFEVRQLRGNYLPHTGVQKFHLLENRVKRNFSFS